MTEPLAEKIGVVNLGTVFDQTNNITIHEGQRVALVYSDPVPDRRFFQGRVAERSALMTWLNDRDVSIIGLRGEGGIGKSTLAAKAFADCPGFAGKFWADVRTGTSITALAARALMELGVLPEQVRTIEEKDLLPRLLRLLQQERYLLAIDNLESVLTATGAWQSGYEAFLDGFQAAGSDSVLLLASREYPPQYFGWQRTKWLMVEQGLEPAEGSALLAALESEGTDVERAALSAQVRGNPLALSLLAGWLRGTYRPGERSVQQLETQSDLFRVAGKHRGEQAISVERVFDWSFTRLTSPSQHLLTQISVLRGAFNAAAAAALVSEQAISEADLEDLERRSLLQILPKRDKYGSRVFQLQPRIQDFGQKRATDLTAAHERAIAYFWSHRKTEFATDDTQAAVTEYEETFYHECQLGRYVDAFATVFACDKFLRQRGYNQLLVKHYTQLHTDWQPTSEHQQEYGRVCGNLGIAYQSLGQYQRAIEYQQQSLELARATGDRCGEASSLANLGTAYRFLGQYQQAIEYQQQSLELARAMGDRCGEANALGNLGTAYDSLGQYQQAINYYQQSLELARALEDRGGEASTLGNLGIAYQSLGQYQQAIEYQQQSLELKRAIGNRGGEASSLGNLGNAYQSLGQYQQAINYYQQHYELARAMGDRGGEANALGNLGSAYDSLGQYQQAINYQQQSLELARAMGDRRGEASSLGNLGIAYQSLGQYQQAIEYQQQSLELKRAIGDRGGEANSLGNLGNAYQSLGQYQQAIEYQQQSLELARAMGDRRGEASSLYNRALSLAGLDDHLNAQQSFQQALAIFEELQLDHLITQCKAAIAECSQLIAVERQVAPAVEAKPSTLPDWYLKSLPDAKRSSTQRPASLAPFWLWVAVGLAIALLIWWLKK